MKSNFRLLSCLSVLFVASAAFGAVSPLEREAQRFLKEYEAFYQPISTKIGEAYWKSSTDVTDLHVGARIGAEEVASTFYGNRYVIENCRKFLAHKKELRTLTARQLDAIYRAAANYPATIPDVVSARVEAEAKQSEILDSFEFCLKRRGDKCVRPITSNDISDLLQSEADLSKRQAVWEASKEVGLPLKPGLTRLRELRNKVAREMGYSSYFDLQVADYDMSTKEMMSTLDTALEQERPLYEQAHCWAKRQLATRFKQPVPKHIPAHWLGNKWGQSWPGLVEGVNLNDLFKDKTAKWIVEQAETFYVSLGFKKLPTSFWEKSDLYALGAADKRKKNTHASAWHINLNQDVRSLMSVKPDWDWFGTAHHELGHIFYYLEYSRPDVPVVLRDGANRAFHEAIGDVIFIASTQLSYLRKTGLLPADRKIDQAKWLLSQAIDGDAVFIPFSAGVMSRFEHDLYEKNLPESEYNSRWWELVSKYQGIDSPTARPSESCDACTKSHINDDAAQYYDYALAMLIKYQLHQHICTKILRTSVHDCDYSGHPAVGEYLRGILRKGKTQDWRKVMMEATGGPVEAKAMLEYFEPAQAFLTKENAGYDCRL